MSGYRMGCAVVMLSSLIATGGVASAQTANEQGCTLEKQVYTCDWQAFVHRLNKAQTIAIETQQIDRFTAKQLRELVGQIGKTAAPENQLGDLTMLLIPLQPTGVHIGPGGEPLATLRIYASAPGMPRSTLLWAETYTGQPDRPWPSTVHSLIQQFQDRLQKH